MKLVFAGTPSVAVPALRSLADSQHLVDLVLTREDAPRGRKRTLTPSEVATASVELGLPVLKANRIDGGVRSRIADTEADLGVVVAYGALLDEETLALPRLGWINLHFSLLPAWRGAAPVQHNLIHGGPTGVTVFQLDSGVDTGPIWEQRELPVGPDATAGEVLEDFAVRGAELVRDALNRIALGERPVPQQGPATRAPKLSSTDGQLTADTELREAYARFRGVTPEPGAYILDGADRLKVLEARPSLARVPAGQFALEGERVVWGVADGALELRRVQPAGKPSMSAGDWWRGRR